MKRVSLLKWMLFASLAAAIAVPCFSAEPAAGVSAEQTKSFYLSKDYSKSKIKKIALIVARMGNVYPAPPLPVTLKTDYSIRKAKEGTAKNNFNDRQDVYIDNYDRIEVSFPRYPTYKKTENPLVQPSYLKSLSLPVFQKMAQILTNKGYEVVDVNKISAAWPKPFYELTVNSIITRLKGKADALFVLDYSDVGEVYMNNDQFERLEKGLTTLYYTASMFDIATKERIFSLDPVALTMNDKIGGDPDVLANKFMVQRIDLTNGEMPGPLVFKVDGNQIFVQGIINRDKTKGTNGFVTYASYKFIQEEVLGLAMKYISTGFENKDKNEKVLGFEQMIP